MPDNATFNTYLCRVETSNPTTGRCTVTIPSALGGGTVPVSTGALPTLSNGEYVVPEAGSVVFVLANHDFSQVKWPYDPITGAYTDALMADLGGGNLFDDPTFTGTLNADDVVVAGDLTVTGNTTYVGDVSTANNFISVGTTAADGEDRGIKFEHSGGLGFFGYDESTDCFTFISNATDTAGVISGTPGLIDAQIDWSNVINTGGIGTDYLALDGSSTMTGDIVMGTGTDIRLGSSQGLYWNTASLRHYTSTGSFVFYDGTSTLFDVRSASAEFSVPLTVPAPTLAAHAAQHGDVLDRVKKDGDIMTGALDVRASITADQLILDSGQYVSWGGAYTTFTAGPNEFTFNDGTLELLSLRSNGSQFFTPLFVPDAAGDTEAMNRQSSDARYVEVLGDVMTGDLAIERTGIDATFGLKSETVNWEQRVASATGILTWTNTSTGLTPLAVARFSVDDLLQVGVASSSTVTVNGLLTASTAPTQDIDVLRKLELDQHKSEPLAAHAASAISLDTSGYTLPVSLWYNAQNVEDALDQIVSQLYTPDEATMQAMINAANDLVLDPGWDPEVDGFDSDELFASNVIVTRHMLAGSINAAVLTATSIQSQLIAGDTLKSINYAYTAGDFSDTGTWFDLQNGDIVSEEFSILNGNAKFLGEVSATTGAIGGWQVGTTTLTANTGLVVLDSTGSISVGSDANKINLVATANEATTRIASASGLYGGGGYGFYFDASGRVQFGDESSGQYIQFTGTTLVVETPNFKISGGGVVTIGSISAADLADQAAVDAARVLAETNAASYADGEITLAEQAAIDAAALDATTKANAAEAAAELYVQSRGNGLVTNGNGQILDNTNFSDFVFDASDTAGGFGMFTHYSAIATNTVLGTDEYIAVDPYKVYELTYHARSTLAPITGDQRHYGAVESFDIDGWGIQPYSIMKVAGSTYTTLAADLDNGDTVIELTDSTGWYSGPEGHQRSVGIWPYTSASGYTYPDYSYTRNFAPIAWAEGGINYSTHVITLSAPWAGGSHSAGDPIANTQSGGTYDYIAASDAPVTAEWQPFDGVIGGVTAPTASNLVAGNTAGAWDAWVSSTGALSGSHGFRWGTAYIKPLWLAHYGSSTDPSELAISTVSLMEAPLRPGDEENIVGVYNANPGSTTISGGNITADSISATKIKTGELTGEYLNATTNITVGTGATSWKLDGTADPLTTAIHTSDATWANTTGVWLDASGRVRLGANLEWDGTTLDITGTITSTSGTIGGWTINPTSLQAPSTLVTLADNGQINVGSLANGSRIDIVGAATTTGTYVRGGNALFNTGTGFYFDASGRGFLGASGGDNLRFNGTQLIVDTTNFSIDGAGNVDVTGAITGGSITGTVINNGTGTFSVDAAGALIATSGTIGGVTIDSSSMYVGTGAFNNDNTAFYVDTLGSFSLRERLAFNVITNALTIDTPNFGIDAAGNVDFSGQIQANSFELWDDVPGVEELQAGFYTNEHYSEQGEVQSALSFWHNDAGGIGNAVSSLLWESGVNGLMLVSGSTGSGRGSTLSLTDGGVTITKSLSVGDDVDLNNNNITDVATLSGSAVDVTGEVEAGSMNITGHGSQSSPAISFGNNSDLGFYSDTSTIYATVNNDRIAAFSGSRLTVYGEIYANSGTIFAYGGIAMANTSITAVSTIRANEYYGDLGSVGDPSFCFGDSTAGGQNTGLYGYNADTLGFTANGAYSGLVTSANTSFPGIWVYNAGSAGTKIPVKITTSSGRLGFDVSSLRFKEDVERADYDRLMKVIDDTEAIWFRPKGKPMYGDNLMSQYGFAAERIHETDPHFAFEMQEEECDCTFPDWVEALPDNDPKKHEYKGSPENHKCRKVTGVLYEDFVVPLLVAVKDLRERVAELEDMVAG